MAGARLTQGGWVQWLEREGDGRESARYAFEGSGLERGDDSRQARQCDRQQ